MITAPRCEINLAHYATAIVLVHEIDALLRRGYHLLTTDGRRIFHFDQAIQEINNGSLCPLPDPESHTV